MISPVLIAVLVGLAMITLRIVIVTSRTSAPGRSSLARHYFAWLDTRPETPRSRAIAQTLVAVVLGITVVLLLDRSGLYDDALHNSATPGFVLAIVVILQIAVMLAVLVIIRVRSRASSAGEARRP